MIDPLETIIQWLKTALTALDGRVANKHRFDGEWTLGQTAVCVEMDDGAVELYAAVGVPRLELRIYAADRPAIVDVWGQLVRLSRTNARFEVETSEGMALVHYFEQASGLSFVYDDDLKVDVGVVFFESMISEEAVS
jgi:hypothetical protein